MLIILFIVISIIRVIARNPALLPASFALRTTVHIGVNHTPSCAGLLDVFQHCGFPWILKLDGMAEMIRLSRPAPSADLLLKIALSSQTTRQKLQVCTRNGNAEQVGGVNEPYVLLPAPTHSIGEANMKMLISIAFGILIVAFGIGPSADPLPAADRTVRADTRTWAPAVTGPSFQQVQTTARASGRVAQYCAPADEDFDAPRVYCRSEPT
jgi:hypothetical protein